MRIVQIGTNRAFDDLSEYLITNYETLDFGLFVEPNILHIDSIRECYGKYNNINIENIAIRTPLQKNNILEIYYHTNDYPYYQLASCNVEHIKNHLWCPHLWRNGEGEIKSFTVPCMTLEELFSKYEIEELDWLCLDIEGIDAEILLTFDWQKYKIKRIEFEHLHLGYYEKAILNMMVGMGYTKVDSLHEYDWAFENKSIIFTSEKLKNFPPVNFISIEESEDRRDLLYQNFQKYGIENITAHVYKKYEEGDCQIIEGPLKMLTPGKGPVTSHLKAIKEWYENTEEEYAFFCEDDLSFESVKYWNFTWEEFFDKLPDDWGCVQLCVVREDMFLFYNPEVKFRHRCFDDWSGCAYLINRKHAKSLVENYYPEESIILEYKGKDKWCRELEFYSYYFLLPTIENLVYSCFGNVEMYSFPLFLENICFNSTWLEYSSENQTPNSVNLKSHKEILNWWETKGKNISLNQLINL
jgi:hypothetical protein